MFFCLTPSSFFASVKSLDFFFFHFILSNLMLNACYPRVSIVFLTPLLIWHFLKRMTKTFIFKVVLQCFKWTWAFGRVIQRYFPGLPSSSVSNPINKNLLTRRLLIDAYEALRWKWFDWRKGRDIVKVIWMSESLTNDIFNGFILNLII